MNDFSGYIPRHLTIIVGAYGSGKSEISVNLALSLAAERQTYLADLDIINPFYRSADTADKLKAANVTLISSVYAGTNVDVPAVPAEVNRVFVDKDSYAVLDIGGEDLGARIVGSLRPQIEQCSYDLLMAVNPFRPYTDTAGKIAEAAHALSTACKLPLGGFIYNPNLLEASDSMLLDEGWPIMMDACLQTGLGIKFATVMSEYALEDYRFLPADLPILKMKRTIHYPSDFQEE